MSLSGKINKEQNMKSRKPLGFGVRAVFPRSILAVCASAALLDAYSATFATNHAEKVIVWTVDAGDSDDAGKLKSVHDAAANELGYPIVVRAYGKASAGSGFAGFKQDLIVEKGLFLLSDSGSMGKTDGCTIVSNEATIVLNKTAPLQFKEDIYLAGTIANWGGAQPDAFNGKLTLLDDAICSNATFGIGGTLALDGHSLFVRMNKSASLIFTNLNIVSGGNVELDVGSFAMEGDNVISARAACNFPCITVDDSMSLKNEVFGFGGTVEGISKTGSGVLEFDNCLKVTGETVIQEGTLRIGGSKVGVAGLVAAVTNFESLAAWENYRDAFGAGSDSARNLLALGKAQGFAKTVLKPEDAYRQWGTGEINKLGVYSGYIWNNDSTNKVCTFATSIGDTAGIWINGEMLFVATKSKKDSGGHTHFVTVGESVLRPGPNSFMFLLGRHDCGTKTGTRDDKHNDCGIYWTASNGLMCREGRYVAPSGVTNVEHFARLIDPGDGSLFTLTKEETADRAPAGARYLPQFDNLIFGYGSASRSAFDLGGLVGFPQNGMKGCPYVMNGSMALSGEWIVSKADLDAHPMELAADAGISFENAVLKCSVASMPRSGTVILRAAAGATVQGLPTVSVTDGGCAVWEIRKDAKQDGSVDFVLFGRMRGTVVSIR